MKLKNNLYVIFKNKKRHIFNLDTEVVWKQEKNKIGTTILMEPDNSDIYNSEKNYIQPREIRSFTCKKIPSSDIVFIQSKRVLDLKNLNLEDLTNTSTISEFLNNMRNFVSGFIDSTKNITWEEPPVIEFRYKNYIRFFWFWISILIINLLGIFLMEEYNKPNEIIPAVVLFTLVLCTVYFTDVQKIRFSSSNKSYHRWKRLISMVVWLALIFIGQILLLWYSNYMQRRCAPILTPSIINAGLFFGFLIPIICFSTKWKKISVSIVHKLLFFFILLFVIFQKLPF